MKSDNDVTSRDVETTFIGSAYNFEQLLDPAVEAALAGQAIGLYMHGVGMNLSSQYTPSLANEFAGRGSGVAEFGSNFGYAEAIVQIQNNSHTIQYLYVGTDLLASNGSVFEIENNVHSLVNGERALSASYDAVRGAYYYAIAPGDVYTIHVEATALGVASNVAANQITGFSSPSALTVLASTAATGGEAWSSVSQDGLIETYQAADGTYSTGPGFFTDYFGQFGFLYHALGNFPQQANVNVDMSHAWTQRELLSWEAYVDNARAMGVLNIAPIAGDNDYSADLTQPFATSPWYTYLRQAELYSGGISFDTPPSYFFAREQAYRDNVVEQIQWANANGLRSSVIISPDNTDAAAKGMDSQFLAETKEMVAYLQKCDAMPSQFIVENYNDSAYGEYYDPTDPNSLTSIALYLSTVTLTPTNSEAGQETVGSAVAADLIVTGQAPSIDVGIVPVAIFGNATIYGESPTQQVTVSVTLDSASLGVLHDASGHSFTTVSFAGTPAAVTAKLAQLQFVAAAGAMGSEAVRVSFSDTAAPVTTVTQLLVDTHVPLAPTMSLSLDTLVLNVSADVWQQGARFIVDVDGSQVGGVYSTSALKSAGASDNITLTGLFRNGPGAGGGHRISVDFINDAHGSNLPADDINLYVNSITLDGVTSQVNNEQGSDGWQDYWINPVSGATTATLGGSLTTNVAQPQLQGTAEAGAIVTVSATTSAGVASVLGQAVASSSGVWVLAPATALASGTYAITAIQTDAAGTSSLASAPQTVTIDTHVPSAPTLTLSRNVTNITTPGVSGTAEAGATVIVTGSLGAGLVVLGQAVASSTGSWSLTSTALAEGTYLVAATQIDAAGTQSAASTAQSLTIDTTAPAAPTVSSADTLVLNVSADVWKQGPQFTVYVDGKQYGGVYSTSALKSTGASQNIVITGSFGVGSGTNGAHQVSVNFLNDAYGSGAGQDINLYVNSITLDGATVVTNAAQLSGGIANYATAAQKAVSVAAVSNQSSPVLSGSGEAGDTVSVTATQAGTSVLLGTTTVSSQGVWSLASSRTLANGVYALSVHQADAAGNVSANAVVQTLNVDTHVPLAPTMSLSLDTLVLNVSADVWQQGARFIVDV
ncbi:hypothetical protein HUK83_09730, partial [Endobacter medicaginis]